MIYEDEYKTWAIDYDLFGEIDSINQAERDFLTQVFSEHNTKSILDCACGTGQHLIMLRKLGYDMYGSDNSDAMLKVCRDNLKRFGLEIPLRQGDYRRLQDVWNNKFDAVLCLTSSLLHMLTKDDLLKALVSMRKRLSEKGVLIITQGTTHKTLADEFRFDLVVNNPDFTRVFVRDMEEELQIINILDIFHSDARSDMIKHAVHLNIVLDDDYRALLQEAGFKRIYVYGDYDRNPYDKEKSTRLIVVAKPL